MKIINRHTWHADLLLLAGLSLCLLFFSGCQLVTPRIVTTRVTKTADGFTIESPKDIKATFKQAADGSIVATYESRANSDALAAGSAESQARAAAIAKLAEAAASIK